MWHLIILLEAHAWYVLLLAGVATIFFGSIRVVDLHKGKLEPRARISRIVISLGLLLLASSFVFLRYAGKLAPYPNLEGRWSYEVHSSNGEFSHKGDCDIEQEGSRLRISGTRKYTCERDGKFCRVKDTNAFWKSNWAQICEDGAVRFEYNISLDETMTGFCRLNIDKSSEGYMRGGYSLLPPFPRSTPNALQGLISFTRLGAGEKLQPPTEQDLRNPLSPQKILDEGMPPSEAPSAR